MIEREQKSRRNQRLLTSVISLALLLLLLSAWCAVNDDSKEGQLTSLTTGTVQVTLNPTGEAGEGSSQEGDSTDGTGASPGSGFERDRPLLTEVLGTQEEVAPEVDVEPVETPTEAPEVPEDAEATATEAAPEGSTPTQEPAPDETTTPEPEATATPDTGPSTSPPVLTFDGVLAPGSYATGGVRVSNTGGSDFRYSVTLEMKGDESFAAKLKFRISLASGANCIFSGQPTSGDNLRPVGGGRVVYTGSFASGNKIGNPAVGEAIGDILLPAGESEVLCMELFFPWSSGNEFQDASVDGTFVFTAKTPEE